MEMFSIKRDITEEENTTKAYRCNYVRIKYAKDGPLLELSMDGNMWYCMGAI